jgi:excisionase family DNA binding protein
MLDRSTANDPGSNTVLSDQPPFLTVQQASKLLRVSTWVLYQAIRLGELPVIRWGRRVVLEREDLAMFLASKRDEGISSSRTSAHRSRTGTRHGVYAARPTAAGLSAVATGESESARVVGRTG